MRITGILLTIIGAVWALFAFNMNVSVTTEASNLGSGDYSINIPSVTVNNIGLMDQRRNHLIFSGIVFLAGIILTALGKSNNPSQKACPFCAEQINAQASICKHCHKTLPSTEEPKQEPIAPKQKPANEPSTIAYCSKCTAMNEGHHENCFRCGTPLTQK